MKYIIKLLNSYAVAQVALAGGDKSNKYAARYTFCKLIILLINCISKSTVLVSSETLGLLDWFQHFI